ncbi:2974_t:CDS:2, partial [Racocetra fulgida]
MRALHFSWFCFLTAFTGWFAVAPLLPTIKEDLNLTDAQIGDSNIASVSSTIIFRILSGPLCEKFGARRVMSAILIIGAIPTALVSLSQGPASLITFRFFVGILGATFVPCQFWTTQMFSPNTVGGANALSAGWGNMGGGVTYLLMPLVFEGFNIFFPERDWYYRDQPNEGYVQFGEKDSKQPKTKNNIEFHQIPVLIHYLLVFINPNVVLMMVMYACCFGVEVAVDNVIVIFFYSAFDISQTTAGLYGSIFGLLNIFSRVAGGLTSDFANKTIVPYLDPAAVGIVTGLVGAGGNIGGLIFAAIFKAYASDLRTGFMIVGLAVLTVSLVPFLMSIHGRTLIFGT